MIELRDYQKDVYERTKKALRNGSKGICVVLPCRSREILYNG